MYSSDDSTTYACFAMPWQMGEQLSRALEAKMSELMTEMELRLRPSPVQEFVPGPSFDHRVDTAITTLEVCDELA